MIVIRDTEGCTWQKVTCRPGGYIWLVRVDCRDKITLDLCYPGRFEKGNVGIFPYEYIFRDTLMFSLLLTKQKISVQHTDQFTPTTTIH